MARTALSCRALAALLLVSSPLAGVGCGSATEEAVAPRVEGETADLQFSLSVRAGQGTMVKPSEQAIRDALINAGFRVGDEKDADVVLELALSDVNAPRMVVVTINGKVQTYRRVTAVMKALSLDGKVLAQKSHSFEVSENEGHVEASLVAPLIGHFSASEPLERYALERSIERAERSVSTDATPEVTAEPEAAPPENTSRVREQ